MYRLLIKRLLFLLPPELAHQFTTVALKLVLLVPGKRYFFRKVFMLSDQRLEREVFGLKFSNPVGLAAGFDKDGRHFREIAALGFGFVEIGTVTPLPQNGNPKPRLFRLPGDFGLINRMGFNNEGVDALVERLKKGKPKGVVIGGNIGKNKITPNDRAADDYLVCFEKLFDYVDYFVVNVSSPNTPGLRQLQEKEPLTRLLSQLQEANRLRPAPKPILLKIAPDLSDAQLDDILAIVQETSLAGIIATNTTLGRVDLQTPGARLQRIGDGGLSGRPLASRSTEVIRYLHQRSGGQLPIIGVGGIDSPAAAIEKLEAGAALLQVYTGLVYEGPGLVRRICKAILERR